ncbi:MAG: Formyl-CoA transferase [Paucimonas sp.]|nr:Formyl-CoA transferase [Paucimonas sp.]
MNGKPLNGVRILDLTRVVSGPFATMQLGDLGAEVIKIEEPGHGDDSRAFGPPFIGSESAYFLSVNRNKQSCCIDLKTKAGKDLIRNLVLQCDVVVENFRPGTMERLGIGYSALKELNPRLVYCTITGFGSTGLDAQRPGYDLIIQGESGFMDITGQAGGPPTKVGTSIGDMVAGLYAAQGILAAILERNQTGVGSSVHVSMLDAMASLLTFNAGIYFATGESPTRRGNEHPTISPYETFKASDGWLNLGVANDKFWDLFCDAVDAGSLKQDPRFATAPLRVKNRESLQPLVAAIIAAKPRMHWVSVLGGAGVPCGSIKTIGEVCEAEQLTSRGMVLQMPHPVAGEVKAIASPVRLNDLPNQPTRPPPLLGADTAQVLQSLLGLTESQVASLEAEGAIRTAGKPLGSN